jgi:hypothetical protein
MLIEGISQRFQRPSRTMQLFLRRALRSIAPGSGFHRRILSHSGLEGRFSVLFETVFPNCELRIRPATCHQTATSRRDIFLWPPGRLLTSLRSLYAGRIRR